mmetsp:Transcript_44442/g.95835  ORF Transcript_44442/g.95835 Transcript_44442/m.95835 type:complete len:792 (+) Transcript_44442:91-2466(+)
MAMLSQMQLEDLQQDKSGVFAEFLAMEPPAMNGEDILKKWEELYDEQMANVVLKTTVGPSDDTSNPVFPYEKLQAVIRDGGNWKWPRMWQRLDEIERRGTAFREGERLNFAMPNKNTGVTPMRCLVVGGGPVGLRLAIELVMAGHKVTVFEKRRELRKDSGDLSQLGFTNRINRPHMWPFVRNDLAKLNGKDFMSRQVCYPVFTEPETSSIGIDELQCLLLKNALLLGVDFKLGVGYDNARVRTDPKSMMPTWEVECTYDEEAAKKYGREKGKHKETFDCLIGCDGPRSTVRDTQAKYFGNIEKRKFMDCVGIVANVRKVPKSRLKQMGFEYGQEPGDMNRSKMVFKDFFKTIADKADADIESLIYYKASFHNYCILVPKRTDLEKHGLSGKVYHFAAGRDKAADDAKSDEKAKLKEYCRKVLVAAGVPVDETAENGGFVDAPNDVMAFDFAECWNTKKSVVFNYPPCGYDVEVDGPWMGRNLIPFLALAGDALLEPFWPLGLGLKRGWQAIMDTCYAIDNLFNRSCHAKRLGKPGEVLGWEEHYEAHKEQVATNFELCNRLKICPELGKGEYDEKGPVITQLKKKIRDAEKPMLLVEVDPWTRYDTLAKEQGDSWKMLMRDDEWIHPQVQKCLNMQEYYQEVCKSGKNGEIEYEGKPLISINGKVVAGFGKAGTLDKGPAVTKAIASAAPPAAVPKGLPVNGMGMGVGMGIDPASLAKQAQAMEKEMRPDVPKPVAPPTIPKAQHAPAAVPAGMSAIKQAELAMIRSQIQSLEASLEAYRKAEQELLNSA